MMQLEIKTLFSSDSQFFSPATSVFILIGMLSRLTSGSQSKFSTVEETIDCYECRSSIDGNCKDPFNATAGRFPVEPCKGCCVKIVMRRPNSTNNEVSVWRTCTAKLEMSHSLIHEVCMDESNGRGHLCICSESKCNSATTFISSPMKSFSAFYPTLLALSIALIASVFPFR